MWFSWCVTLFELSSLWEAISGKISLGCQPTSFRLKLRTQTSANVIEPFPLHNLDVRDQRLTHCLNLS